MAGASSSNGTLIQQWDFNGGQQQKWSIVPVDSQYYKIVSVLSGKVLDVTGVSTASGALIQEYDYWGGDNQLWQLVAQGDGYFAIVSKLSGKVLDDSGVSTQDGSAIQQWDFTGGDNQLWKLAPDGTIPTVSGSTQSTVAQTSDGSVSGVSILSLAGGNAVSYSATELDYVASAFFNSYTAGFIFDEGADVAGAGATNSGTAPAAVGNSVPSYPWHDYQVESDHWLIAYFLTSSGYYDPFGFVSSGDDSGDIIFDQTGVAVWLASELLYLGSTYADQTYVPQDLIQNVPTSDSDNTVYIPSGGIPTFTASVTLWTQKLKAYALLAAAAAAIDKAQYGQQSSNKIPFILALAQDYHCTDCTAAIARARLYYLKDTDGKPWNLSQPVSVQEAFTPIVGTPPAAGGYWSTGYNPPDMVSFLDAKGVLDVYGLTQSDPGSTFLQRYYAYNFSAPASLYPLGIATPGFPGYAVPLIIKGPYNRYTLKSGCTYYISQLIQLVQQTQPSVNGDLGWLSESPQKSPVCPQQ